MTCSNFVKSTLPAAVLGFLALGFASTSALASTNNSTTFQVNANVVNTCTLSASNMAFGTVVTTNDNTADSAITITCTLNDTYTIGLGAGFSTVDTARTMKGTGSNTLAYGLYSDAGRSVNWGQTVGAQTYTGSGQAQTVNIHGKITAAQAAAAPADANYSDTITVYLTY